MAMTQATAMPIFQLKAYADSPPSDSVRKISSGAYATDDNASLAKTGSAMRFGSKRLTELGAAELAADQRALGDLGDSHERRC